MVMVVGGGSIHDVHDVHHHHHHHHQRTKGVVTTATLLLSSKKADSCSTLASCRSSTDQDITDSVDGSARSSTPTTTDNNLNNHNNAVVVDDDVEYNDDDNNTITTTTTINSKKNLFWDEVAIVGREDEINTITTAYERILQQQQLRGNNSSISSSTNPPHDTTTTTTRRRKEPPILLYGESGTGKSALVEYIKKRTTTQQSNMVDSVAVVDLLWGCGKYEQQYDDHDHGARPAARPYGAIADATAELCHNLRKNHHNNNSDNSFHVIQSNLQRAFNEEDIRVLLAVFPAFEVLLPLSDSTRTLMRQQIMDHATRTAISTKIENEDDDEEDEYQDEYEDVEQRRNNNISLRSVNSRSIINGKQQQQHDNNSANNNNENNNNNNKHYSFQRFAGLYTTFLKIISTSQQHPTILFLDDIQWADDASKQLISSIVKDTSLYNFLLILSARVDEEEEEKDKDKEEDIQCQNLLPQDLLSTMTHLKINRLTLEDVNIVVAKATQLHPNQTIELSDIVYKKTLGNTFFVIQYLEILHRECLLEYTTTEKRFVWDIHTIETRTDIWGNVLALLLQRMKSMPVETQLILFFAASLGFTFKGQVLEATLGRIDLASIFGTKHHQDTTTTTYNARATVISADHISIALDLVEEVVINTSDIEDDATGLLLCGRTIWQSLDAATSSGLIEVVSTDKYKFIHDKVQQSALCSMITHGHADDHDDVGYTNDKIKHKMGKIILALSRCSNISEDWMIFTAVDLLIKHPDQMDKKQLAELCLEAGSITASRSAFHLATTYANNGIKLLGPNGWMIYYPLCLDLYNLAAEMTYCDGSIIESRYMAETIVAKAHTVQDRSRAYSVILDSYSALDDWNGCIQCAKRILSTLGIRTPRKNVNIVHVVLHIIKCKMMLKGRKANDLLVLPQIIDPRIRQALRFMQAWTYADYLHGESERFNVICLMMFQITLKHGISPEGVFSTAVYGMTLSHLGDMDGANGYCILSREWMKCIENKTTVSKTAVGVHGFLNYLSKPMNESVDALSKAYEVGMSTGDVLYALLCLSMRSMIYVCWGRRLADQEADLIKDCQLIREFKQDQPLDFTLCRLQLIQSLQGKSDDPSKLTGEVMDDDIFLKKFGTGQRKYNTLILVGHFSRLNLLFVMDKFVEADVERRKYQKLVADEPSTCVVRCFHFVFCGLTCFSLAWRGKNVRYFKRQAKKYKGKIKTHGKGGADCFIHILELFRAEELALEGKIDDSLKEYNMAITGFGMLDHRLLKAITAERAGRYLLRAASKSYKMEADMYLIRAFHEYKDFGAYAKTTHMRRKHGNVYFGGSIHGIQQQSRQQHPSQGM